MPVRLLREGILTSDRVDLLDFEAEVFYRRLMSIVDDFGRFDGRHSIILSATYPLRVSTKHRLHVTTEQVGDWLDQCIQAKLVHYYFADGKPYIEVLFFKQQVRAKSSKYPTPPPYSPNDEQVLSRREADAGKVRATAHLDGDGDGDGDGNPPPPDGGGPPSTPPTSKKVEARKPALKKKPERAKPDTPTLLDPSFAISEAVQAWATEKGYDHLAEHLVSFKDTCKAKGYSYIDWDAAFRKAVREDWAKLRRGANGAPPPENAVHAWHETNASVEARGLELGLAWNPTVWYGQKGGWQGYKSAVMALHEKAARG